MYQIHGFNQSFNTTKVLYVAEELGIDYQYAGLDPAKGEHKTPEHLARHPLGKTPTLDHDGKHLFESSAICRYLAAVEASPLYPISDHYRRALIDQWIDFFSAHTGRWLGTLLFERVFREAFGMGKTKQDVEQEALGFLEQQMAAVDQQLSNHAFVGGDALSIADGYAFAYLETTEASRFSLDPYPNVARWLKAYGERESVSRARARVSG